MNNKEIIQNILLSKNLYTKNILRHKISNDVGVLDYTFSISNARIKQKTTLGQSILYSLKDFKHKNCEQLKLRTFLPYQQVSSSYETASNFNNATKKLAEDNSNTFMRILGPVKGGFIGYYAGIYGFIPKSHLKALVASAIDLKNQNLANKLYFSNLHNCNNLLKPRTLFSVGKIAIQPNSVVNNFNKLRTRQIFNATVNFVFLSKTSSKLCKTLAE